VALCYALAGLLLAGSPAAGAADRGDSAAAAKPKGGNKGGKKKGGTKKGGREGRAVGQVNRAGCPGYRAIDQRKYSSEVRRAARRWRFEVFHFKSRLKPPINWERDPFQSRSYRQQLHGLSWLDVLFNSYRKTGDIGVLRQARDIALDWIKSNPRRFQPGRKGFAWHPKAAADRAGYLGYLTRTAGCKGQLNRKQARLLVRSLNAHGQYLANSQQHHSSNFGLFQDLGLLYLSQYLSFEKESDRWRKLAVRRFPETLTGRLSSEGMWLEHSTQYQFLAVRLLRDYLKYRPGKKRDPALEAVLARLRAGAAWLVAPGGNYALIGDTVIDRAPTWGYSTPQQGAKTFAEAGYSVVRKGGSYLAATASFHNTTHKHADELDFNLVDRGLQIVNGPGNYGYDREEAYRNYQLASNSHSVLIADAQSFPIQTATPYGAGIQASGQGDGWYGIQGTNPLLGLQGVAHSRLWLYAPGETLIVLDRVRAAQPHTFHRFYQLGSKIGIEPRGPGTLGMSGPGLGGALYDQAADNGDASRALVKGRPAPLQGFEFPGFRQAVPRWSIEYISEDSNADYATVFTLNGATQRGDVSESGANHTELILTESGQATRKITVDRSGGSLSIDSSSCTGPCLP
jgi:hypothetical protein